jgi:hypothetical protein
LGCDQLDEPRTRFGSYRPHCGSTFVHTPDDLSASILSRRRPGYDKDAIPIVRDTFLGEFDLDRAPAMRA